MYVPQHFEETRTEELHRVIPVIEGLRARVSAPISVDTYRAEIAEAALAAGASIVNDVWGFRRDPEIARVVRRRGAVAVAMHNRSAEAKRLAALLRACWTKFDRAAADATGAALRKGPHGGGRELEAIVSHLLDAERRRISPACRLRSTT